MTSSPAILSALEQWRAARADYETVLEAQIEAADRATRGVMLNARAERAGISIRRVFLAAPHVAAAWASEELLEFWRDHPRVTFAAYEREHYEAQWSHEWGARWPPRAAIDPCQPLPRARSPIPTCL